MGSLTRFGRSRSDKAHTRCGASKISLELSITPQIGICYSALHPRYTIRLKGPAGLRPAYCSWAQRVQQVIERRYLKSFAVQILK